MKRHELFLVFNLNDNAMVLKIMMFSINVGKTYLTKKKTQLIFSNLTLYLFKLYFDICHALYNDIKPQMHLYMRLHTVLLCYTVKTFNHVGNTNTKLLNVPILSNLLINKPESTPDYSNAFLRRAYDVSFSALYT